MKINKISLIESESARVSARIAARIEENGDLLLEGCDRGDLVRETFGDADYEYTLKVEAEYKDTILLHLIREKFKTDSELKAWLDEKQIPSRFWSY